MLKEYYTTGELAQLCHVDPTTIFRAIVNRSLKAATTPGGHFRIHGKEVESFLRKNNIPIPDLPTATPRILIVEDNPAEQLMFRRALGGKHKFEVKTTGSGYEAGFLTQLFRPDLILMDIFLADMDGREAARLIRSDPKLKHTKILAVTGSKDPNVLREIRSAKFDAVVLKPIEAEALRRQILALLP
jgi:excisionase family DNA binding protein